MTIEELIAALERLKNPKAQVLGRWPLGGYVRKVEGIVVEGPTAKSKSVILNMGQPPDVEDLKPKHLNGKGH